MRKYKDRHVTGACGCCLAPFIILLIVFVAAVVFTALVWHAAIAPSFGWGPMRHHDFDAYRAGFQQGNVIGEQYASRGQPELAGEDLEDLAWREAERLHVTRDRNQWMKGFRDGFTRGFESFSKQALRESGSTLLCYAAKNFRVVFATASRSSVAPFVEHRGRSEPEIFIRRMLASPRA